MGSILLYSAIALLTVDSLLEMAFIATTVGWLHVRAGGVFPVEYQGSQFLLNGKPLHLLLNQGHASNGSAGTGYIAIGAGGLLALWLRHRQLKRNGRTSGFTSFFYNFWLVMTVLSSIYAMACLVYVFVQTYGHNNQHIDLAFASTLKNEPYPNNVPYPRHPWTPQNWFPAVLELPLVSNSDRSDIQLHLTIMKGWQWNLIPMVVLNLVVMVLAFMDRRRQRNLMSRANGVSRLEAAKIGSPYSS